MNRLIQFAVACCFSLVAFAANPSFNSFDTTQFDIRNTRVALTNGVIVTNLVVMGTTNNTFEIWDQNGDMRLWVDTNGSLTINSISSGNTVLFKNTGTNIYRFKSTGELLMGAGGNENLYLAGTSAYANVYGNGISGDNQFDLYADDSIVQLNFYTVGFLTRLHLNPTEADGVTPYFLDTSSNHTSGNLFEVKNNTTNKFVVPWDGAVQIPGDATANSLTITNDLNVRGSLKVNTMIVTNNVNFYNNTYTSNLYVTNIFTAPGASAFNTFTANSGVISNANGLTIGGNIAATYAGITNVMTWALSDMTTALTTGTNKNYWYAPAAGMTIKFVRATVALASSSGTPTFDINEAGTSILSTKITIDQDEFDSLDATSAPVISDSAIAAKAKIDFDIDVAGTGSAGAQIQIGFTVP